ncbi:MAG: glycosyltransferase [Bacteroidales bacterium]|nr:glycosyltransferase [Bacteroidales bacterium]
MLKIGFDAKRLFNNYTGLGNYSRTLVSNLQINFPDNEYFLYSPSAKNNAQTENFYSDSFKIIKPNHFFKNYWRTFGVVNNIIADDLDIYHGLSHELPIGAQKSRTTNIVTIHDLLYLLYPDNFSAIDRKIYDFKFRHACKVADKIVAISNNTKKDIITYFGIEPEKISVIYQTCSDIYKRKISQETIDIVTKNINYQISIYCM